MLKWPAVILICLTTSGCLGNFSLSDAATGGGAIAGAGIAATLSASPPLVAASALAGAVGGAAAVSESQSNTVAAIEAVPEEDRARVAQWLSVVELLKSLGFYAIGAVLLFFLIPLLIGYFMPNGKQRRQKKEMIIMKEKLFDNPDIKMNDIK